MRHSKRRKSGPTRRQAAVAAGFRSGFESDIAKDLDERGIKYFYEQQKFTYFKHVRMGECADCGAKRVTKRATYTPDFYLPEPGFYVESKGRLTASDRTKLVAVRASNPGIDLRLQFMANNWTTKLKREKYTDWAARQSFVCAVGKSIPAEWIGRGTDLAGSGSSPDRPKEAKADSVVHGTSQILSRCTHSSGRTVVRRKRTALPRKAGSLGPK